jgi:hypothetical protein
MGVLMTRYRHAPLPNEFFDKIIEPSLERQDDLEIGSFDRHAAWFRHQSHGDDLTSAFLAESRIIFETAYNSAACPPARGYFSTFFKCGSHAETAGAVPGHDL